jgi:hypothetical protein
MAKRSTPRATRKPRSIPPSCREHYARNSTRVVLRDIAPAVQTVQAKAVTEVNVDLPGVPIGLVEARTHMAKHESWSAKRVPRRQQ